MTKEPIRVLLVDDHPLVREGIRASLHTHADVTVIGEASDGIEAIEQAALLKPDVILLDFSMPRMNGLEAAKILRKEQPKSEILIFSMHNQQEYFRRFLELGVKGYLSKDATPSELNTAVHQVFEGQVYIGAGIGSDPVATQQQANGALEKLSKREHEVLKLLATSSRNKDIALKLGISIRTVEKHRSQLMKKLGIDNVAGLTRYALAFEMT